MKASGRGTDVRVAVNSGGIATLCVFVTKTNKDGQWDYTLMYPDYSFEDYGSPNGFGYKKKTTFLPFRMFCKKLEPPSPGGVAYAFRNPPKFRPNRQGALHETEMVLDSYFYHPNTPPFISSLLIKRLVGKLL